MSAYQTVEAGSVRWKTYPEGIIVTDLANAGKRSGKCTVLDVGIAPSWATAYYQGHDVSAGHPLEQLMFLISPYDNFSGIVEALTRYVVKYPDRLDIEKREECGVDVEPIGFAPVVLRTPRIGLKASSDRFIVNDLTDRYNGSSLMHPAKGKRTAVKAFYKWASENRKRLEGMTFTEVGNALDAAGIKYHFFCAVD